MRRAVIYSCLIGWLVIFFLSINFFESLTMFLLFGVLPWSQASLSAQSMLAFYYSASSLAFVITFRKQFKNLFVNSRTIRAQSQA